MENLCYNITGDLHLERIQYGIAARYEDNQACIAHIINDTCTDPQCQGLILTGDNFNKKTLLPKYQMQFKAFVNQLQNQHRLLYAIDGNHDGSDASWLDTIDPSINAHQKLVQLGNKNALFVSFQDRKQLYETIKLVAANIQVLVLHGRLLEMLTWAKTQQEPDYDFSARELRDLGVQHCTVLMGDIHTYSDYYDPVGDNWFIYAGSTEMSEVSEGNIISQRFGNSYDTTKKFLKFYPYRPHGQNWELQNLPNRPFLKRVIGINEQITIVLNQLDEWVIKHPNGILSVHYPIEIRDIIQAYLAEWKTKLMLLTDVPISAKTSKPLQDMREIDILTIAEKELSSKQINILKHVLTQESFESQLKQYMTTAT